MFKNRLVKKALITSSVIITLLIGTGFWLVSLLPESPNLSELAQTQVKDIPYLQNRMIEKRGTILAVVTSTAHIGETNKTTGYELTELSRAYWIFTMNGFEVDIASVKGGIPPVVIDNDDMKVFDYAFLNDKTAQYKVNHSLKVDDVDPANYQAVYFVGGKGAMFDFPNNIAIQNIIKQLYQSEKIVAAICHGPAAFTNVKLDNGEYLISNMKITSFTNDEELLLTPNAKEVFPFLLEDKLKERGANFEGGFTYLNQVHRDKNLITGQNPWSIWETAEQIIQALGYIPIPRTASPEEHSIELLQTYVMYGYDTAYQKIQLAPANHYDRIIVAMHSMVALMKFDLWQAIQLIQLTHALKIKALNLDQHISATPSPALNGAYRAEQKKPFAQT